MRKTNRNSNTLNALLMPDYFDVKTLSRYITRITLISRVCSIGAVFPGGVVVLRKSDLGLMVLFKEALRLACFAGLNHLDVKRITF